MKNKKNNKKIAQKYSDFVYGVHSVLELLQAKNRKIGTIYTTKTPIKSWHQIQQLIPDYVQIQFVSRDALTSMAGTTEHQSIIAFVSPFPFKKAMFESQKHPFVLVLDGIQDVRNMGAIIRSAYCAGIDGIVLTQRGTAPINAAAIKASAGLAEHAQIYMATSINAAITDLQKNGYNIYLATLGQGENAVTIRYKQPTALVIGSEETGISSSVLKSGTRVLLPQRRADISYNASVAAGILLFLIGVQIQKI